MRITSGSLRGRTLRVPNGVRPTQDRVRQALFSSLGDRVRDARVLDLFAGSGALGIEAWSRGAARACWVEKDRNVFRVLRENVAGLCAAPDGGTECILADALVFLQTARSQTAFDIVFADPPYRKGAEEGWFGKTLRALEGGSILAPGGVLVFERGARESVALPEGWSLIRDKTYGDTRVLMCVRARD